MFFLETYDKKYHIIHPEILEEIDETEIEYFDVLNEKGRYINKVETRDTCHRNSLWHKAVALFIINSKNQVLLQKRSKTKKIWPSKWDMTAGGHVLAGEFGFEAVIREPQEEIGVNIQKNDLTFLGCTISNDKNNKHFNEFYIVNTELDETKLKLCLEEVEEVKWVEKEEIIAKIRNNYEGLTGKIDCWNYLLKYYEWKNKKI